MIEHLDEKSAMDFLVEQEIGRLGCVLETGEPYVVPVAYLFIGDELYLHSLPGMKISAMRENPEICLQTDLVADDGLAWKSVIAFGEFEEVKENDTKANVLLKFYEKFPQFTPVEANIEAETSIAKIVVFKIKISRLTGASEVY